MKLALEDRIKNRGKRPAQATDLIEGEKTKKKKEDDDAEPASAYMTEVKKLTDRSLKDDGVGLRPLVK